MRNGERAQIDALAIAETRTVIPAPCVIRCCQGPYQTLALLVARRARSAAVETARLKICSSTLPGPSAVRCVHNGSRNCNLPTGQIGSADNSPSRLSKLPGLLRH